ncbi:MAG: hypothetical protein AABM30_12990 [Actinomycetota bacterium]
MRALLLTIALLVPLAAACGSEEKQGANLPQGAETVKLDPAEFTTEIDNPYWPMAPGDKWVYREGEQRVEVTVTNRTKVIGGVEARVVHDVVTVDGKPREDTFDWYAQDKSGNLWYLGEDTKEFENGKVVSTKGSWEAGVDGAQAGILLPAEPKAGMTYRQEYYKGEAEDAAQVLSVDEKVEVPFGAFDHVLLTKDYTPLDPSLLEHKFYARGVGPVLAIGIAGGFDREELLRYTRGR